MHFHPEAWSSTLPVVQKRQTGRKQKKWTTVSGWGRGF
jgi:hypothetical protein